MDAAGIGDADDAARTVAALIFLSIALYCVPLLSFSAIQMANRLFRANSGGLNDDVARPFRRLKGFSTLSGVVCFADVPLPNATFCLLSLLVPRCRTSLVVNSFNFVPSTVLC